MKLTTLESWSELNEPCFSICKNGKEILQTVRQSNDEPPASQLALDNVNDICEAVNNYNALKDALRDISEHVEVCKGHDIDRAWILGLIANTLNKAKQL